MKGKRKLSCLILTIALVLSMLPGLVTKADATSDVGSSDTIKGKVTTSSDQLTVSVSYGINSVIKYGADIPVTATVTNNGKDFSGTIAVITDFESTLYGSSVKGAKYQRSLNIAAGETKTVSIAVPSDGISNCKLNISNSKGKTEYESKIFNNLMDGEQNVIAFVLSDDYTGVNYLDGNPVYDYYNNMEYSMTLVQVDDTSLPDNESALEMGTIMIIDDFDTSKLSASQISAIEEWVESGRILILSLGNEADKVLSGFNDGFVSGTLGDITKQEVRFKSEADPSVTDAEEPYYKAINSVVSLDVQELTLDDGENVTWFSNDSSLVQGKYAGDGAVLVTEFSLGQSEFKENDEDNVAIFNQMLRQMINGSISAAFSGSDEYDGYSNNYFSNSSIKAFDESPRPKLIFYTIIIFGFIIIIGPAGYLIMRKVFHMGKGYYLFVPAMAVVATLLIALVSINQRVKNPVVNSLTVCTDIAGEKSSNIYFDITNSKKGDYQIDFTSDIARLTQVDDYYSYNYSIFSDLTSDSYNEYLTYDQDSGKNSLGLEGSYAFEDYTMTSSKANVSADALTASLGMGDDGVVKISVTNNTDEDMYYVLIRYAGSAMIDVLKAGETQTVSCNNIQTVVDYATLISEAKTSFKDKWVRDTLSDLATNVYGSVADTYDYNTSIAGYVTVLMKNKANYVDDEDVDEYGGIVYVSDISEDELYGSKLVASDIMNYSMDVYPFDYDSSTGQIYQEDAGDFEMEYEIDPESVNQLMYRENLSDSYDVYVIKADGSKVKLFENGNTEDLLDDYLIKDEDDSMCKLTLQYILKDDAADIKYMPVIQGRFKDADN